MASSLVPAAALAGTSAYDDALQDFMETLEAHMRNCERLGRYSEADVARSRLAEVKEHELFRRKEAMRSRHLSDMLGVEELYVQEFAHFQQAWHDRMAAFEGDAAATLLELKRKHDAEMREFQQKLLIKTGIPRHSREYFNIRKIEEYHAKLKNYAAANEMKEKADALEEVEEEKWNAARQEDLLTKEAIMRGRTEVEAEGVREKLNNQRADLGRKREKELNALLIRYANAKAETERHHKQERMQVDKAMAQELRLIRGSSSPRAK